MNNHPWHQEHDRTWNHEREKWKHKLK